MRSFEATTFIPRDPADVWRLLVQTDQWPSWDVSVERVDGTLGPNGGITVHVVNQSRPFKLKVVTWKPGQQLVLKGGMPLGLFAGTRTYDLARAEGGTTLHLHERFSGPLAPLIGRSIPDLQPSFDAFVAGLKAAAGR
jgi:hypothetical protein